MTASLIFLIVARSFMSYATTRLHIMHRFGGAPQTNTGPRTYHDPVVIRPAIPEPAIPPHHQRRVSLQSILEYAVVAHTKTAAGTYEDPMIDSRVNPPHAQSQVAAPSDDDVPELWVADGTQVWKAKAEVNETWIPQQMFPPKIIYGMDARQLVENWNTSLHAWHLIEEEVGPAPVIGMNAASLQASLHEMPKFFQDDEAVVLRKMHDVIAEATSRSTDLHMHDFLNQPFGFSNLLIAEPPSKVFEIVGLIPNDLKMPILDGSVVAPAKLDASLLALGIFSRGWLEDDSKGSLRKKIEKQYGTDWTHCWWGSAYKKQFGVFAIEGLAHAPGVSEPEASVLLSKLEKYAHMDYKVVWLPKHAYISSDGTDLVEYYVRLGFKKVKMEDGSHEMLYMGVPSSAEAMKVEHDQIMVGMHLQTNA